MGWGFRKSVKLAPGVRLNLSKSGISTSLGGRGATVNIGRKGMRTTVGIPGTGLSFSQRVGGGRRTGGGVGASAAGSPHAGGWIAGLFMLALLGMCMGPDDPSSGSHSVSTPSYGTSPYDGTSGYGTSAYSAAAERESREWFYIHGNLNVRAEPNGGARLVRTLRSGDFVQLGPKDESGWARLYSVGSAEGYVYRASDLVQRHAPVTRSASASSSSGGRRSNAASRGYYTGPRGGCYYYNGSGNKQYVDRSHCR